MMRMKKKGREETGREGRKGKKEKQEENFQTCRSKHTMIIHHFPTFFEVFSSLSYLRGGQF